MFSEKTGNPSGRPAWVAGQPKKTNWGQRDLSDEPTPRISNQMQKKQFTVLVFFLKLQNGIRS